MARFLWIFSKMVQNTEKEEPKMGQKQYMLTRFWLGFDSISVYRSREAGERAPLCYSIDFKDSAILIFSRRKYIAKLTISAKAKVITIASR